MGKKAGLSPNVFSFKKKDKNKSLTVKDIEKLIKLAISELAKIQKSHSKIEQAPANIQKQFDNLNKRITELQTIKSQPNLLNNKAVQKNLSILLQGLAQKQEKEFEEFEEKRDKKIRKQKQKDDQAKLKGKLSEIHKERERRKREGTWQGYGNEQKGTEAVIKTLQENRDLAYKLMMLSKKENKKEDINYYKEKFNKFQRDLQKKQKEYRDKGGKTGMRKLKEKELELEKVKIKELEKEGELTKEESEVLQKEIEEKEQKKSKFWGKAKAWARMDATEGVKKGSKAFGGWLGKGIEKGTGLQVNKWGNYAANKLGKATNAIKGAGKALDKGTDTYTPTLKKWSKNILSGITGAGGLMGGVAQEGVKNMFSGGHNTLIWLGLFLWWIDWKAYAFRIGNQGSFIKLFGVKLFWPIGSVQLDFFVLIFLVVWLVLAESHWQSFFYILTAFALEVFLPGLGKQFGLLSTPIVQHIFNNAIWPWWLLIMGIFYNKRRGNESKLITFVFVSWALFWIFIIISSTWVAGLADMTEQLTIEEQNELQDAITERWYDTWGSDFKMFWDCYISMDTIVGTISGGETPEQCLNRLKKEAEQTVEGEVDQEIEEYVSLKVDFKSGQNTIYFANQPISVLIQGKDPTVQEDTESTEKIPPIKFGCVFIKEGNNQNTINCKPTPETLELGKDEITETILCKPEEPLTDGKYTIKFFAKLEKVKTNTNLIRLFTGKNNYGKMTMEERARKLLQKFPSTDYSSKSEPEFVRLNLATEKPLIPLGEKGFVLESSVENMDNGKILKINEINVELLKLKFNDQEHSLEITNQCLYEEQDNRLVITNFERDFSLIKKGNQIKLPPCRLTAANFEDLNVVRVVKIDSFINYDYEITKKHDFNVLGGQSEIE